jgi:hypothetical protein
MSNVEMRAQCLPKTRSWLVWVLASILCVYVLGMGTAFVARVCRWQQGQRRQFVIEHRVHPGLPQKLVVEMVGTPNQVMTWTGGLTRLSYMVPEFPFTKAKERVSGYEIDCTNGFVAAISPCTTSRW